MTSTTDSTRAAGLEATLAALVAAPRHVNSAVAMWLDMQAKQPLTAEELLQSAPQIRDAIKEGEQETDEIKEAWRRLKASSAEASTFVPTGF